MILRWFENRISPFQKGPESHPPNGLWRFYRYFVMQSWKIFAAVLIVGFFAALIEVSLFAFLGELVNLMKAADSHGDFFNNHSSTLMWMAAVALILRPAVFAIHVMLINQAIVPNITSLVRWQTHKHVLRQSMSFFNNDFAGRIANRIMQTAPSLRESVVQVVDVMWFAIIYAASALVLFAQNDYRLMVPLLLWLMGYTAILYFFIPKVKQHSKILSESRSTMTGRIVDSYTNVLTAKLFSDDKREDQYVGQAIADMTTKFHRLLRGISLMEISIWLLNGVLIVSTCGLALWLWNQGVITLGAITLACALVIRLNNMSSWIMFVITGIFEHLGTVQDGMEMISKPHAVVDKGSAAELQISHGRIEFKDVCFGYQQERVIRNLSLAIEPRERIGIVGPSGAGKSTLMHLLLRFYDIQAGQIRIDDQNIAEVSQQSLRSVIGVVTQDASLLHRSVMENVLYGNPNKDQAAAMEAAKKAHAHDFIMGLEDMNGNRGYQACVGERGVQLSGGQRQRIAIARVLVKDAPVLILDEATSALDSGVEAAIQEQLSNLMQDKTVIAIAHRLSTIASMDRLVVMDQGRIVEQGNHGELLEKNGLYAKLWQRQSGGFLGEVAAA